MYKFEFVYHFIFVVNLCRVDIKFLSKQYNVLVLHDTLQLMDKFEIKK